ncbi:MAG TPA: amidase [Polyangiaceae bacterium]|nr:amidase [Polyangiaceae bacterium]
MPPSLRLNGAILQGVARFARTRAGALALHRLLRADLGIDRLATLPDGLRGDPPPDAWPRAGRPPRAAKGEGLPWPEGGWAPTARSLTAAYRAGSLTPPEVVARALAEARRLATLAPPMGPFCAFDDEAALAEARASERRWRRGEPLGPLDGVPWAIKEEAALKGLPRQGGTSYLDAGPQPRDATAVARVRAAGAIALGLTSMTEHGMTPNGSNANRAMPHNPHAPGHLAGGSSTGSGVAVATGLVPFALGVDGGGSIRIPAAINGVFGLKPTWGRVSRAGDLATGTVSHLGPIGASTADVALALEAMSGPDPDDAQTLAAPPRDPGSFTAALGRGARGLVVGVPETEWGDASGPVARAGRDALAALEREGARLVPVSLQLARHAAAVGYVVIACETLSALREDWRDHADAMGYDLQASFAALGAFGAVEYLDVLRLREGLRREAARAFESIDLLALPSTVSAAARVSDLDVRGGFLDTKVLDGLCRFCFFANLTGLPAASAPVGVDADGLPLGLQLVGDAWDEATVLAASAHLERVGAARARRPRITAAIV